MPSPFPGMNPYLEQQEVWHDFHERLIPALADTLAEQAGSHYVVKIDDHIYVHELAAERRHLLGRADLAVAHSGPAAGDIAAAVSEAPALVWLPSVDVESHSFLEIRDRRNRELITVLEVLSPSNKRPGPDREQYIGKRSQLLHSTAHFVEIDLLRGGERMPVLALPTCDYYVLVSRYSDRPRAGLWPIGLRDRLPSVSIPLRAPDPDARIDLQAILHRVYDAARYGNYIYDGTPEPPLGPDHAIWAASFRG
jgi:hypothetical protein